jgi:hypothetical protein
MLAIGDLVKLNLELSSYHGSIGVIINIFDNKIFTLPYQVLFFDSLYRATYGEEHLDKI